MDLEQIYETYFKSVYLYMWRLSGNEHLAEEITSETFLYQLYGFNFLHIGDMSFWTPYIILISAAVEIPLFLFLAIRAYCKHRVA